MWLLLPKIDLRGEMIFWVKRTKTLAVVFFHGKCDFENYP